MTQTTFSQNNVKVLVSDNTVSISSPSTVQLSFSSTNELVMSVSDSVVDMACGVCGKLRPIDTTLRDLRERLLVSFHGQSITFASLNFGQWQAPDFPQW